jgi:hypothetical protein
MIGAQYNPVVRVRVAAFIVTSYCVFAMMTRVFEFEVKDDLSRACWFDDDD